MKTPGNISNEQLRKMGSAVSLREGISMVAPYEMMRRYGRKLTDGSKDSENGCNLKAARLASLT